MAMMRSRTVFTGAAFAVALGVLVTIDRALDPAVAQDPALAKKLTEVCAVDIFALNADGTLRIVEENLDECVLCDLCLEVAPGKVKVVKLYE